MAAQRNNRGRIEPSFADESGDDGAGDDWRLDPSDRVAVTAGGARANRKGAGRSRKASAAHDGATRSKARGSRRRSGRASGGGSGGGSGGPGSGFVRLARRLVYWSIVAGIWGAIGIGGIVAYYAAQMPSATTWSIPDRPPNVKILSVRGEVMANRGATGGEALALNEMSPFIPEALIAIEDRRFYSHFGIDPLGLARALVTNLVSGRTVQGGSTITQQLAKNLFLSPDRTIERKVQEVLLALWLEHRFTKDQILEMYLNRVYFGAGAYGVEAASRRYFKKPAKDVTLAEAAMLAGLLKAPSRLSPANDPKAAEERAQVVLQAMRESGFVTDAEVATAISQAPTRARSTWSGAENYVADMVMDDLKPIVGDIRQDLVVETTIDLDLEHDAEKAISGALDKSGDKLRVGQGALVALDGTGAIRALVGGRDYAESQFNRASDAKRQPGSAFKPFVYTAAMEMGRTPYSVRNDAPVRIGNWTPENYEKKYNGPVTLTEALSESLNTIAAQLVMEVGPKTVVDVAHRMGITSDIQPNASIALGTSEVSLMELTSAYAPFMNGGYRADPYIIEKVSTLDGKVLYQRKPPGDDGRVLEPTIAAEMNAMMRRVVIDGTGKAAALKGWDVAGKTGTTQNSRDALFLGYTANLVTGVWFGNDDGTPMKRVTGGALPAQTWHEFMTAAHRGLAPMPLPYRDLPIPGGEGVDPATGLVAGGGQDLRPQEDVGTPMAEATPGSIVGIIERTMNSLTGADPEPRSAPRPPADLRGNATEAPYPVAAEGNGRRPVPIPPGDVGTYEAPHGDSLLDVLLGR